MRPSPALMTLRIIWFALLMSAFLYIGLVFFVLPKPTRPARDAFMLVGICAMSAVVAVMSFIMPRILYRNAVKRVDTQTTEQIAPNAFPGRYREVTPKRIVFADPVAAQKQAYLCFQTPFIMSLALSEAIAICGLVLAQLGYEALYPLPFFIVGILLIAIRFPRHEQVIKAFEQAREAVFPAQNG